MIDTHAHLNYVPLSEDVAGVLARATAIGVQKIIVPGTSLESSQAAVRLAQEHENVFAAVGVHPTDSFGPWQHRGIVELLKDHPEIVAYGEIGLDYKHFEDETDPTELMVLKSMQAAVFKKQIAIAKTFQKPLIIHTRDAFFDAHRILATHAQGIKVVIHCFTGTLEEAKSWLDLGFNLSLTGILTYKNNQSLREVVKELPLDRLMLETDAPFLAPQKYRGQSCEPAYVGEVAMCLAEIKGVNLEEVDAVTTATAEAFFGI